MVRRLGEPSVEDVYRTEFGRVVAGLAARFGDLDLAEEMTQEAFVEAVRRWPLEGVPPNPGGWLTVVARNRALDRLRRESSRRSRHEEAQVLHHHEEGPAAAASSLTDERLRLVFTCCHPALSPEARVALTLRLLGGLTVPEVAAAFLVPERTMAQRITRAKRKIAAARIPYRVPGDAEIPDRLRAVLAVVYLVFTQGHLPRSGEAGVRADLCSEAIRLGRLLRALMPDEPEVAGLLALMLLTDARRPARFAQGRLVTLDRQDRLLWDRELILEGHALVRECLERRRPGHYQLMAAVGAVHTDAASAAETDWEQVLALYDQLYAVTPTAVVALNRAVALAEVDGPAVGFAVVEGLRLQGYAPWHVVAAELLRRLGRAEEAATAYGRALELTENGPERAHLEVRLATLGR
ncbi:MAG: sigma-70 family RNA polymerase sigma factor [Ornithinibacter sp.]